MMHSCAELTLLQTDCERRRVTPGHLKTFGPLRHQTDTDPSSESWNHCVLRPSERCARCSWPCRKCTDTAPRKFPPRQRLPPELSADDAFGDAGWQSDSA